MTDLVTEPPPADAFATPTSLPGLVLLAPKVFRDARGSFRELWHDGRYAEAGVAARFVQDNVSYSRRGVLRGLHLQHPHGQGKLVAAALGRVYDVAVDVRADSPTFGRWESFELSEENGHQLYIPPGFAHGFQVCSEAALVLYKATDYYAPGAEHVVRWDDPDLGIAWPLAEAPSGVPTVAPRDAAGRRLRDFAPDELPRLG